MAWPAGRSTSAPRQPKDTSGMGRKGSSRLVARFALSSLVAFLALGAILSVVMSRQLRGRAEDAAQFHAQFVADSILSDRFKASDLRAPMAVASRRYPDLLRFVPARILLKPGVRVRILGADRD